MKDTADHLEFWIALLPSEQRQKFSAWLERHSNLVCGRAFDNARDFLAALPGHRVNDEAFILLGEIAWHWRQWKHVHGEERAYA